MRPADAARVVLSRPSALLVAAMLLPLAMPALAVAPHRATEADPREEPPPPVRVPARPALAPGARAWLPQGPSPSINGQTERVRRAGDAEPTDEVAGAVQAVVAHPTDPDVLWIGAVNGGVWRTDDATAPAPAWIPLTDQQGSLSIGTLVLDPTDGAHRTLVAGTGRTSSFGRSGGGRRGLLRTTDGGGSWTPIDGGGALVGRNVSGVAAAGPRLVVAVNAADSNACADLGLFRSADGGATFARTSPPLAGRAWHLAADPADPERLYTVLTFAGPCGAGSNGLHRSDDGGATWTPVGDAALGALLVDYTEDTPGTANVKLSVGAGGTVWVGIVNAVERGDEQLAAVLHSTDAGATWTALDLPGSVEGRFVGIHPGGQGDIHFALLADPADPLVVYVGGDRQPHGAEGDDGAQRWPNAIGARTFSGRLFRGDASQPSGARWQPLTHAGTAGGSAPHADARGMAVDAAGDLIEVDDGGVYRRTAPRGADGDWLSVNGSLQIAEVHDVAFDAVAGVVVAGTQDTGTVEQIAPGAPAWRTVTGGDGGDVAIDDRSAPDRSVRWVSSQNLLGFHWREYDAANVLQGEPVRIALALPDRSSLADDERQFVTPVELNAVDPERLVLIGRDAIYESRDRGQHLRGPVGPGPGANPTTPRQNALAYGGRRRCRDRSRIVYAGVGTTLYVRAGGPRARPVVFPGDPIRDVALDPDDWRHAFAADATHVYETRNGGRTWARLPDPPAADLRSLALAPGLDADLLVAGTGAGVWTATAPAFADWRLAGAGLPNAPVHDLEYDAARDVLVAGTLGRGAWLLPAVAGRCADAAATYASVDCRLAWLGRAVASCARGLARRVQTLRTAVAQAAADAGDAARALRRADRALTGVRRELGRRAGRSLRRELLPVLDAVRRDLDALAAAP